MVTYFDPVWESRSQPGLELERIPAADIFNAVGRLKSAHARNKYGYETGRSHVPGGAVVPPVKWRREWRTEKNFFSENDFVWVWASKGAASGLLQSWVREASELLKDRIPAEAIVRGQSALRCSQLEKVLKAKYGEDLYTSLYLWEEGCFNFFDESDDDDEDDDDETVFWSPPFDFSITGVGGGMYLCRFVSLHSIFNSALSGFTKYRRSSETFFDEYVSGNRTVGRFVWPMSSEGGLWTLGDWPGETYITQSEFWSSQLLGFDLDRFEQLIEDLSYQVGSPEKPTRRKASDPDCIEVLKQDLIEAVALHLMPFRGSGFDEAATQVRMEKTGSDQIGISVGGGSAAPGGQIVVCRIDEWLYRIIPAAPEA